MVISEIIKLDGTNYQKTYSDSGMYIERDGVLYAEAIDPIGSGRSYTESDREIETEPETVDGRLAKIAEKTLKNMSDIEYLAMMTEVDLDE